nr:tail tubular protein B [uncultured Mediterranean phage uvMED]
MGLITTALPNLVQGVSQQPDAIRFDGQCSEQTNAISSVVDGLQKRPNTRFIAKLLNEAIDKKTFVHFINRSDTEQYVVLITPNVESETAIDGDEDNLNVTETTASKLRIFNMFDGTECEINDESNGLELTGNNLSFSDPSSVVKALTVADSTFLLNRATIAQPKSTSTEVTTTEEDSEGNETSTTTTEIVLDKTNGLAKDAVITIDQGAYSKEYSVQCEVVGVESGDAVTSNDPPAELPTLTFQTERFVADFVPKYQYSMKGKSKIIGGTTTYGWKIKNLNFTSTGAYLKGPLQLTFKSNKGIARAPKTTLVLAEYQADDTASPPVSQTYFRLINTVLHDGGHFKGSGSRHVRSGYHRGGQRRNDYYFGETEPNIDEVLKGGGALEIIGGDASGLSQNVLSGSSVADQPNKQANTDIIAGNLKDKMFPVSGATGAGERYDKYFNGHNPDFSSSIFISAKASVADDIDFSITTKDSLSGTGLSAAYKEVDSIANLPVFNKNGFKIKIRGDAETGSDDYYVQFKTNSGAVYGEGSYVETVGFEQEKGIDPDTMPQELVNLSPNVFTLRNMSFADKLVGDDETNPLPSFVGNPISNMFFYKGRLGFLSNSNVVLSEAGFGLTNEDSGVMEYNFGRTTVTQLLDSDPIDINVAASKVTNLRSAIGFQEDLVLFSENNQFILKGDEILSPKTVSVNPVTNFDFDDAVDPISVGSFVLFPFERSGFTGVKQLEKTGTNDTFSSTEITEHIPHYIPSGIKLLSGSTSENFITVVTEADPSSIYCYRYFYSGNNKVMSSWFKFELDGEIVGLSFLDSSLRAVLARNDETSLLEMQISSGLVDPTFEDDTTPIDHVTLLDMRVQGLVKADTSVVCFADDDGEYTTNTALPYTPSENELEVYTKNGTRLNATNTTAGVVSLPLNVAEDTDVWVGLPYNMSYTFSDVLFKAAAGKGKTPTDFNKMQVRHGVVFFHDTQSFRVKVTPQYRKTYDNDYVPYNVGSSVIGELALSDGAFRFPVMSSAKDTTITIENDTALPSNFSAAEFESFVHGRSSRYAQ